MQTDRHTLHMYKLFPVEKWTDIAYIHVSSQAFMFDSEKYVNDGK